MKWSIVRPKILEVLGTLAGIETHWRDRERPFVAPTEAAMCLLHTIAGADGPGDDEFRLTHNVGTNKLDITQAGIRNFTVSVMVESFDHADDKTALEYLAEIRDGLKRPEILADLRSINLAVLEVGASTDLTLTQDDHALSSASLDIRFAYGNNVTSAEGKPGLSPLDWIETVDYTAEFED